MARWSHGSKTVFAKLVYYGPALGGKTTNLQQLHRITDPECATRLLSVKTADDRTLFFDLLPFDLGEISGYKVAVKVYTVPGQVRYDLTRRIVLAGADAVIFVADSSAEREEDNRASLANLVDNMRENGLDPAAVPVLFQFNKQDLPDAAPPGAVARWLGTDPAAGFPAVATTGRGVLETFVQSVRLMLEHLAAMAGPRVAEGFRPAEVARHLDRVFRPHFLALAAEGAPPPAPFADRSTLPVVLSGGDLLDHSVRASVELGEVVADQSVRNERLEAIVESRTRALRDAYAELRELDGMKARFLSNLSHEMRTPLASILCAAAFLRDYGGSPEERSAALESILGASKSLGGLIENLLRVARIEERSCPLAFALVEPRELAERAVAAAGGEGVRIEAEDGLTPAALDADRVCRAVANLVDNAVKFSPPGAPVTLRVAPAWLKSAGGTLGAVAFSVLDDGPGPNPENKERLFAAFEQGGDPMTGKPKGVGLGLHEARQVARLHGGSLLWERRPEGGSEFRLVLPTRAAPDRETALA